MKEALEMFREMGEKGFISSAFVYTCLTGGFRKVLSMDGSQWLMKKNDNQGAYTYCSNLYRRWVLQDWR
jgi:hypothetical protein